MRIKTKIVSCRTANSKPVKQEVNGTVILLPFVFPGVMHNLFIVMLSVVMLSVVMLSVVAPKRQDFKSNREAKTTDLRRYVNEPLRLSREPLLKGKAQYR